MRSKHSRIRQIIYAIAMPTGVALVGMLLGCVQPANTLSAPGFPRASRRVVPQAETLFQPSSSSGKNARFEVAWIRPREAEK
jgi:hypothetical protein